MGKWFFGWSGQFGGEGGFLVLRVLVESFCVVDLAIVSIEQDRDLFSASAASATQQV
jgi:hypothetical protein